VRTLHKHSLSFDKAFAFFTHTLQGINAFSDEALRSISREKGEFFTLLPDNANLDLLYQFSYSIQPPEPEKRGKVGSLPGIYTYSPIACMNKEFAAFLCKKMHTHAYQFMSDNFNAIYKEGYGNEWFNFYGAHYLEEIYYFLSSEQVTPELIEGCFHRSNTFWHSLCILSEQPIPDRGNKTLHLSDVQEFCKSTQLVLVGAYDGEGFIVWEKTKIL
jgi:hypothetical protein